MTDNNHTMQQILNIIEYGTKEPVLNVAETNKTRDGRVFFDYKDAEAQRVKVLNTMGVHGTKSKVPVEAQGECTYDGVLVMDQYVPLKYTLKRSAALEGVVNVVAASEWKPMQPPPRRAPKTSKHRLFVRCPWCMEDQPIGRIHQHLGEKPCKAKMAKVYAQKTEEK